jgi:DNA polymerase-3 subunit delta
MGFTEREVLHAESGFQWEQLTECANNLSLFAERRLIELRIPNGKPGSKGGDAIERYLKTPSPDDLLVIYTPKLESSIQKSRWFKQLDQQGLIVQTQPIERAQLSGWIANRLQQAGLRAQPDALELLTQRTEGNLLAAAQEIEKLKLYYQDREIDEEEILACVSDSSRYDLFNLTESSLRGGGERCVRIIQGLEAEGVEPMMVLWALSREIRTLLSLLQHCPRGQVSEALYRQYQVWGKRKGQLGQAIKRLQPAELNQLLRLCNRIDRTIKGDNSHNCWHLLTVVALGLAGSKLNIDPLAEF